MNLKVSTCKFKDKYFLSWFYSFVRFINYDIKIGITGVKYLIWGINTKQVNICRIANIWVIFLYVLSGFCKLINSKKNNLFS